jgi:cell division protein FtsN
MALDYNQKKQVNKNRPRKRPVKLLLLLTIGSVISLYGLGIATGWLVFKYLPQNSIEPATDSKTPTGSEQNPAPINAHNGAAATAPNKDPDLTFYYTLPKGEKGVIGSGINSPEAKTVTPNVASTPVTVKNNGSSQIQQQSPQKNVPANPGMVETTAVTKDAGATTYTVQIAAYHEKSDALQLKTNLQKIGISSRIEEYSIAGKGNWYRVRTGHKLDKNTASKIAAKVGNSAILIAE